MPINFNRLIKSCINQFHNEKHHKSDIHPLYILDKIDELIEETTKMVSNNDNLMIIYRCSYTRLHLATELFPMQSRKEYEIFGSQCSKMSLWKFGILILATFADWMTEPR